MQAFRSWRWSALAVAFGLAAPAAQAEMITPDSIPNPPGAVGTANGTPVYTSNLVTTQYTALGLDFPNGSAITHLNGVTVWAPIATEGLGGGSPSSNSPLQMINYGGINGSFVSPGSLNPATVSSLSVEIVGHPLLSMNVYGLNGLTLNIAPVIRSIAGTQVWTFTGPGINSFSGSTQMADNPAFGVAEVSFTTATSPEPSSLVLAGLGVLGFATRLCWRRIRRIA